MPASTQKKPAPETVSETAAQQPVSAKVPSLVAYYAIPAPKGQKPVLAPIGAALAHDDGEGFTLQLHLMPPAGAPIILRKPQIKKSA